MNRTNRLRANIWKYYVYRTSVKRLVWPILTVFLLRNSLSAEQIGIIFAVGTILGLILEVPSGAIADKIGRRNSLLIATLGCALAMFIFWAGHSFEIFLIANAVYWMSGSLSTGTHEAFIYETLNELDRPDDIKKVQGRALLYSQIITGVLFTVAPIIANFSLKLPFLINAFVYLGTAVLVLSMIEPKRVVKVENVELGSDFLGFKTYFTNKLLLYTGLVFAVVGGINGFLEDFRQIYMDKAIHLDLVYFGLVYLGLRILTGVFGLLTEPLEKAVGKKTLFLFTITINFLLYIGLAVINPVWALLILTLDGIQDGLSRPLEQEYVNKSVNTESRATMISIFNFITNLVRAGVVLLGGVIVDRFGIQHSFWFPAILFLVIVPPFIVLFLKTAEKHKLFEQNTLETN